MNVKNNTQGVSLIVALFIIVILAFMGVMFLTMVTNTTLTSVNDVQSAQALYVAHGGLEYILNTGAFPNYSMGGAVKNLGAGNFLISTPSYLTAAVAVGNTTINVNSTSGFYTGSAAVPGWMVIDADTMSYTGSTANTFTGVASISAAHANGNAVYPVASLTTALVSNCTSPVTIQASYVSSNFLIPGILTIGTELFYCTGSTIGTPGSFSNCTRCYEGSSSAAHAVATGNIFQYVVTSTGSVGAAQRAIKAGLGLNAAAGTIAYVAQSSKGGNANTITWNHTVAAAGINRILIVGVALINNSNQTVSSVTYNGIPLTRQGFLPNLTSVRVEVWSLVAPPTGTLPVVVNLSSAAAVAAGVMNFTGVNQIDPFDTPSLACRSGTSTTPSVPITTSTNNAWVIDAVAAVNTTAAIVAPQTARYNLISVTARLAGSTRGATTPAGVVTQSWTLGASANWALCAMALRPQGVLITDWREVPN